MGIFKNPFAKAFEDTSELDRIIQHQLGTNSQGVSDVEMESQNNKHNGNYFDSSRTSLNFADNYNNKQQRIAKYREMSFFPEISEALDMVGDETIVENDKGEITHPIFKREVPKNVKEIFLKEFKYITNDVIKESDQLYDMFMKFLIDGELFIEWILNTKKDNIIGFKILPPFNTYPVYNPDGGIKGYLQNTYKDGVEVQTPFAPSQVTYVNWGKFGTSLLDVRGYLDTSIRSYNQIRSLEDSLIVYRLVRAPERRVWNIETGRMPTQKAEEYIKKIIHKNKRKLNYDTSTGTVDSARNVQSLSEDYWFAKREGGSTSVETLQSGMNLCEMDDVRYFLSKLYKTLRIPKTRWDPQLGQQSYSTGRDLDRDELKFTLFVERIQKRFKKIKRDSWITHLRMKYKNDKKITKYANRIYLDVDFTPANFFKEIKELEELENRLNVLGTAIAYVNTPDEPDNPLSMEFVLKHYFKMPEEEWEINKKLLEEELKKRRAEGDEIPINQVENKKESGGKMLKEDKKNEVEDKNYKKFLINNKNS